MRPLSSRQKLLLVWAVAVAVVAGGVVAMWPKEPVYQGKPLSFWLDRLPVTFTQSNQPPLVLPAGVCSPWQVTLAESKAAQHAINALGSQCLPTLLLRLHKKVRVNTLKWNLWQLRLNLRIPVIVSASLTPDVKRGQAVTALVQLGDTAKPILPKVLALAKSDSDPGVRASAQEVVRHLSPADYARVTGQTNALSAAVQ